jgi:hypothetical protein
MEIEAGASDDHRHVPISDRSAQLAHGPPDEPVGPGDTSADHAAAPELIEQARSRPRHNMLTRLAESTEEGTAEVMRRRWG